MRAGLAEKHVDSDELILRSALIGLRRAVNAAGDPQADARDLVKSAERSLHYHCCGLDAKIDIKHKN